ncbi:MAG: hypothetical protein U1F67_14085 [Rubrivivax sp.]
MTVPPTSPPADAAAAAAASAASAAAGASAAAAAAAASAAHAVRSSATPGATPTARRAFDPALVVILAGVCAALHVGKLPPAIPPLQAALGITLVQAGFLLAVVQAAGMTAGVAFGALADGLTPRRSMLLGLSVLAVASGAGGFAQDVLALMVLRACEASASCSWCWRRRR